MKVYHPVAMRLPWIFASFLFLSSPSLGVQASYPFLKEILQGRCYDLAPTGDITDCPHVVDTFMSVLESRLDSEFAVETFDAHFETVDLSIPQGKPLLFRPMHPRHVSTENVYGSEPSRLHGFLFSSDERWATPESTPGGAFLSGLVFCGIDRAQDCSSDISNAYWKYWEALYRRFVANVTGSLQVMIPAKANAEFILQSIVKHIDTNAILNVTVYADDCASNVTVTIVEGFLAKGIANDNLVCSDDPLEFLLCAPDRNSKACMSYLNSCVHPSSQASSPAHDGEPLKPTDEATETDLIVPTKQHTTLLHVLFILTMVVVASCILCNNRGAALEWRSIVIDKISTNDTDSSISSGSRRRRHQEHVIQESSALLNEVTRNLFLNPNRMDEESDEMESVILQ